MAYEAAGCATLCREVSHQHKATRGTSQQGQASLADHLPCLDCSAASAASPSVIARRAFDKKCSPGTARASGYWAGSRCLLRKIRPSRNIYKNRTIRVPPGVLRGGGIG